MTTKAFYALGIVFTIGGLLTSSSAASPPTRESSAPLSPEPARVEIVGTLYSIQVLHDYFVLTLEMDFSSPADRVLVVVTRLPNEDQGNWYQALLDKPISVKGFWGTTSRPGEDADLSQLYEALRYCLFIQKRLSYFARPDHIEYLMALSVSVPTIPTP